MAAQQGYFVLADISGFTAYLAGVELDHAHEILSDLLETVVQRLTPTLTLAKLEGDAVFVYAPATRLTRGETLLELVETTYLEFRNRQLAMRRRTTCTCQACQGIPTLDLKFMAHYGSYVPQRVADSTEIMGAEVNLVHQLLKNHITEATGWRAYALFTAALLQHLAVPTAAMHLSNEIDEQLGEITTYSVDLHARYQALVEAQRVFLPAAEADIVLQHDYAAPPPVVWEWLNDPAKRTQWMHERTWRAGLRLNGRTAVGARNHCAHGQETFNETILDWRPFDYVTSEQDAKGMRLVETVQLEPLPNGHTRLHNHLQLEMALPPWLKRPVVTFILSHLARYKSAAILTRLEHLLTQATQKQMGAP